jgi:hypothetical protein
LNEVYEEFVGEKAMNKLNDTRKKLIDSGQFDEVTFGKIYYGAKFDNKNTDTNVKPAEQGTKKVKR